MTSCGTCIKFRGSGASDDYHAVIGASAFSPSFVASVDMAIDRLLVGTRGGHGHKKSLVASKFAVSSNSSTKGKADQVLVGGIMGLAEKGADQLDLETAIKAIALPADVMKLLRQKKQKEKAHADPAMVEKAITNLNGMVFEAQKRLDAKNNECEEFKAKSEQTLDQINADLGRLGQELSNTARAITTHMGGIDAMTLNGQQAKEELEREELSYNDVRSADLIVLKEREANLAVSSFILDFSKCPDAVAAGASSASASLVKIQSSPHLAAIVGNRVMHLAASTSVQACVNSTGGMEIKFSDPALDTETKRFTAEGQEMLTRFALARQQYTGVDAAGGVDQAAAALEAMALGSIENLKQDLDDGDVDDFDAQKDDDEDRAPWLGGPITAQKDEDESSLLQAKASQDPDVCGPIVDRIPVPDRKDGSPGPCGEVTVPSCCGCNRYYSSKKGYGNNENGFCTYAPELRKCQSGKFFANKKNIEVKQQAVCGMPMKVEQPVMKPSKAEAKASSKCSNAKFDCGVLHDLFASLWGEQKDLVDTLVFKMNADTTAWKAVQDDVNALLQTQATQLAGLQSALAEASAEKAAQTDEQGAKQKEKQATQALFDSTMKDCRDVMKEILFSEMCGVMAVRNNMIAQHLPGEPKPTDCGVGDWSAGDDHATLKARRGLPSADYNKKMQSDCVPRQLCCGRILHLE
jgi:hypothetical protein